MFYLVYKITNTVNGKVYIGVHRTKDKDDGYMGSGFAIARAIQKYGKENFTKEIICECASSEEMFATEKEMVVVDPLTSYNLIPGGNGGWPAHSHRLGGLATGRKGSRRGLKSPFKGKRHSSETKKQISKTASENQKGAGNSVFGTMWIRNVVTDDSIRIMKGDPIPEGWVKGRKIKK